MTSLKLALAAALLSGSAVHAATYQFTYLADIGTVKGRLTGTLQADNNTVLVDSVKDFVTVGGAALPSLPYVTTGSTIYGEPRAASVTLDGTNLDFFACDEEYCAFKGFGFDPDVVAFVPVLRVSTGTDGSYMEELTDPSRWSLSAVPEPATWGLLMIGFVAIGAASRRRMVSVAA